MSERFAICPVCGRAAGKMFAPRPWIGGRRVSTKEWRKIKAGMEPIDYFNDYILPTYDLDRNYWGVIKDPGGKMEVVGYLERPEDDPELFHGVKEALLLAVRHYLRQGWVTREEIEEILEEEG